MNYLAQALALQRNPYCRGRIMNFEPIRKFHDVLHFGASTRGISLSSNFIDVSNTDPFKFHLYNLVANWFLNEGKILNWIFIIYQWNCMDRSISIYHQVFSNLKRVSNLNMIIQRATKQVGNAAIIIHMVIL